MHSIKVNTLCSGITGQFKATLARFPLSALSSIVLMVTCLFWYSLDYGKSETLIQVVLVLLGSILASASITLYGESQGWSGRKRVLASLIAVLVTTAALLSAGNMAITAAFLLPGALLSLGFAGYLHRSTITNEEECCRFNCALLSGACFAALSCLILCGGLSLALASINYLFAAQLSVKLYGYLWLAGFTGLFPLCVLAAIPRHAEENAQTAPLTYPRGVRMIVRYILVPLVLGYMLILYAYLIKIAISLELPKGQLSWMICSFGLAGVITHFLAMPLRAEGGRLIHMLCRYFYHALLLPLALLWIAISVRVGAYGVTESRYAVMLAALWLSLSAGYVIAGRVQQLKGVMILASVLLILASMGPWGAASVSSRSQLARLQTVLEETHILVDGKVDASHPPVSMRDERRISDALEYFSQTDKLVYLIPWLPESSHVHRVVSGEIQRVEMQKLADDFGITYVTRWGQRLTESGHFYYNMMGRLPWDDQVLSVAPYEYVVYSGPLFGTRAPASKTFEMPGRGMQIKATLDEDTLIISAITQQETSAQAARLDQERSVRFDLNALWESLSQLPATLRVTPIDLSPYTLETSENGLSVRVIVNQLQGDTTNAIVTNQVSALIFIKLDNDITPLP